MAPKPFDELRERLLRGGVAPRHIRRYLTELADHFADLVAEGERAGRNRTDAEAIATARLGDIDNLATAMIAQRRMRSWSARAPWAMFSLGPIAVMAGADGVILFLLWLGASFFGMQLKGFDPSAQPIFQTWYFVWSKIVEFDGLLLPLLIGWAISVIAIRQRLPANWPLIGLVLTAFAGAGSTGMGFGISRVPYFVPPLAQVCFKVCLTVRVDFLQILTWGLANLALTAAPYIVWRLWRTQNGISANA